MTIEKTPKQERAALGTRIADAMAALVLFALALALTGFLAAVLVTFAQMPLWVAILGSIYLSLKFARDNK